MTRLAEYRERFEQVYLQPGEVLMSDEPRVVTTTLGSCVAVCFFDPASHRGAICHGALPHSPLLVHKDPFRYVDEAVLFLLERFKRMGTGPSGLRVKVFGGADILEREVHEGYLSVGRQNVMAALETLGWQGVRPAVRHTGGQKGRKLVFVTHTGDAFVKSLAEPRAAAPKGGE